VADLASGTVRTLADPPAEHEAGGHAGPHAQVGEVARAPERRGGAHGGHVDIVVDHHRRPREVTDMIGERHGLVAEAQVHCVAHGPGLAVDQPVNADADGGEAIDGHTRLLGELGELGECLCDRPVHLVAAPSCASHRGDD